MSLFVKSMCNEQYPLKGYSKNLILLHQHFDIAHAYLSYTKGYFTRMIIIYL